MIVSVEDKVFYIENYLSKDSCEFLTKAFNERLAETPRKGIFGGPSFSKRNISDGASNGNNMFQYDEFTNFNIGLDLMSGLAYRMQKTISDHYHNEYYIKSLMYSKMTTGSKNNLHMDNWYQTTDKKIKPRPYNKLDRSGLLYLNDDYEGGEIYFPKQHWRVKPKAGTLIFFEGNFDCPHEVEEVISGARHNLISFYSDISVFTRDTNPDDEGFNLQEDRCTLEVMSDPKNIVWEYDDYGIK